MIGNSEIVANETRRLMRPKVSLQPVEINAKLVDSVFVATASSFDTEFGGIDFNFSRPEGPKFPTPTKLAFLQQRLEREPNPEVAKLLDLTLLQLACGGIRDHVGGGFHRYSVDRRWDVPHFEKMLYDQAQLADVYVEAFRTTDRRLYKQVAEEIFEFISREMTSEDGVFFSAIDAETNGIEGEYYVWDATEIDNILGTAAANFRDAYRVKELSNFEHGNVLRLSAKRLPKADRNAALIGSERLSGTECDEFTLSQQKLLETRNLRKKPMRDEKILTCWNGLLIGAYARASQVLEHPEYAKTAEKAATFLLAKHRDSQGRLLHSSTNGQAKLNAYLDDYAFLIDGLLSLHQVTEDMKWLKAAKQLQDEQLVSFLDKENGGFYFTSHQHEELLARTKNCYDGVLPAGNSVSARNLIKLAKRTGTSAYLDEARATVELFAPNIEQAPRGFANLALAAMELIEAEGSEKSSKSESTSEVIPAAGVEEKPSKEQPLVLLADQKGAKDDELVKGRAYLSTDKLPAGSTCEIIVLIEIKKGWHINSNPPSPDYLKPASVTFKSKNEIKLSDIKYPKGHGFQFQGEEVSVYEDEIAVRGKLTVPEKAGGEIDQMEITIHYQACNNKECLPPKSIKLTGKLEVAKKGDAVQPRNMKLFAPAANAKK